MAGCLMTLVLISIEWYSMNTSKIKYLDISNDAVHGSFERSPSKIATLEPREIKGCHTCKKH